jgi:ribose 5-phosphate isomerase A
MVHNRREDNVMKEIVAQALARRVKNGEVIGVGTGSTVDAALVEIGKRVRAEGLNFKVVPTSLQSAWRCQEIGLDVLYAGFRGELSWGFDGADEVNGDLWLIKGKGGALLQEKILAARCKEFIVIVDESKLVTKLGENCAIPLEVVPEAIAVVEKKLSELNPIEVTVREGTGKKGPIITEAGNIIVDVRLPLIDRSTELKLKSIVGVVETGLFIDFATEVIVGSPGGTRTLRQASS